MDSALAPRTLWDKLALDGPRPFSRFEDGLQVPLDALLLTDTSLPLRSFFDAQDLLVADAWSPTEWAFAAQRLLESGRARPGMKVASTDPHVTELGAFGIAAFYHTPAPLVARWRQRHDALGLPRRTLVQINDPLPPGTGPVDLALHLAREAGPHGFAQAVLEFAGPGLAHLNLPQRRRLCAAVAAAGPLTALAPFDAAARAHATQLGLPTGTQLAEGHLQSDPEAVHDELVIVNAAELVPLVAAPTRGVVSSAVSLRGQRIQRILLGGCVAGDLDTLTAATRRLEEAPPAPAVEVFLVPASQALLRTATEAGLKERLAALGATLAAPHELPAANSPILATTPCLAPNALLASPETLLATAHEGRLMPPEDAS